MNRLSQQSIIRQRGITLLETLVAVLLLSVGLVAVAKLNGHLRHSAEAARQRSEATRLAAQDIESVRMQAAAASSAQRSVTLGATPYQIEREIVHESGGSQAQSAHIQVSWTNARGQAQRVALQSVVTQVHPVYSGALALARHTNSALGPRGRSARIPLAAQVVGPHTSVFKPSSTQPVVYVFNNATGLITGRCTGVTNTVVTPSDLTQCDTQTRLLLSGVVRFSAASPAIFEGRDAPLPTQVNLSLDDSSEAPICVTEPVQTDDGDRYVAYHCVVTPNAAGQWSGRTQLQPTGWLTGAALGQWRVCRYSADADHSGAIDANAEHPAQYRNVSSHLPHQNFLVIQGSEACPNGTLAHQPG
jgi:Tfp pilus assembly protein PilV